MGFWSFVGSCFRAVGSAISSVASTVYNGIKNVVSFMAEKAEKFIGVVKDVWESVKEVFKPVLKIILWPVLTKIEKFLEKAIRFLEKFDNELAQKFTRALHWALDKVKDIKNYLLSDEEKLEAEKRKKIFKDAENVLSDDEKKVAQLGNAINEYLLVKTEIQRIFDTNAISDFQHYLRLRATQKLLQISEKSFEKAQDISDLGKGELFLLEIGRELLKKDPHIDDLSMEMLNGMILKRYGKNLIPFIFEEMIASWSKKVESLKKNHNERNKILIKQKVVLKPLQMKMKLGYNLSDNEKIEMARLEENVFIEDNDLKKLHELVIERTAYVDAAEGFLQVLEENEQIMEKSYLAEKGYDVGMIIIQCAEQGKEWKNLNEVEQDLIIDYANIFRDARIAREHAILKNTLEMAV